MIATTILAALCGWASAMGIVVLFWRWNDRREEKRRRREREEMQREEEALERLMIAELDRIIAIVRPPDNHTTIH